MTMQEIVDSLEDQARDKDMLVDGPDSIFAQDAKALRAAAALLRQKGWEGRGPQKGGTS